MQYKTITLNLIQEQPELYEQLRSTKRLLPAMDAYATELRAGHLATMEAFARKWPGSHPSQIASQALEMAIQELREHLCSASPKDEAEPLSLDAAMSHIRRRSRHA